MAAPATRKHQHNTMQATAALAVGFIRRADWTPSGLREDPIHLLHVASVSLGQHGPHAQAAILMAAGAYMMSDGHLEDAIDELSNLADA